MSHMPKCDVFVRILHMHVTNMKCDKALLPQGIRAKTIKDIFGLICHNKNKVLNCLCKISYAHLPITRMQNRDQYKMSIRGVFGLALEESKLHTIQG